MPTLYEKNLKHTFDVGWEVEKYDEWVFYRKQFLSVPKTRGVDFLAIDPEENTLWLIELKDYRIGAKYLKETPLWDVVAFKVRDTLAEIMAASHADAYASHAFAKKAVHAKKLRVVLHLEQNVHRAFDRADVQQKLKSRVKAIDAHPLVVELDEPRTIRWIISSNP